MKKINIFCKFLIIKCLLINRVNYCFRIYLLILNTCIQKLINNHFMNLKIKYYAYYEFYFLLLRKKRKGQAD